MRYGVMSILALGLLMAAPAEAARNDQSATRNQPRPAGIDDDRSGLHARQLRRPDDAAGGITQAHLQADDIALLEEGFLALCQGVPIGQGLLAQAALVGLSTV